MPYCSQSARGGVVLAYVIALAIAGRGSEMPAANAAANNSRRIAARRHHDPGADARLCSFESGAI
jgi:hypothetical protein